MRARKSVEGDYLLATRNQRQHRAVSRQVPPAFVVRLMLPVAVDRAYLAVCVALPVAPVDLSRAHQLSPRPRRG